MAQKWEYLTVKLENFGMNSQHLTARFVNGSELKDWKKTSLDSFIFRLGQDSWEMTGTLTAYGVNNHYLFFKRPKP
jgi:hypothetical protein